MVDINQWLNNLNSLSDVKILPEVIAYRNRKAKITFVAFQLS